MAASNSVQRKLPILGWARSYTRETFSNDLLAAVIVTIMLIPQSLAYAMLAGLPPQVGLYASILPLAAYALFGTGRTLAVGPVAVISLMTASAIGPVSAATGIEPAILAVLLAFLSGGMLLVMGLLRLGLLANFLSHPVISGFITASGILIAAGQLKYILGIKADGDTMLRLVPSLLAGLGATSLATLVIGAGTIAFLFWSRSRLKPLLKANGVQARLADVLSRAAPVAAIAVTTLATFAFSLDRHGVRIVGAIPSGLPPLTWPSFDIALWRQLAVPALLISIVGFVESVSVGQTLAARKRLRIDPDQELIGLGAANISASLTGGYPVTGGFARSVVNDDAGAETPAAGVLTAIGIVLAALILTPLLFYLPQATLAATIIVAVLSLVDLGLVGRTWAYSRSDAAAMLSTIAATLSIGVEIGIVTGIVVSLALYLWRASRPHSAVVGLVPGTQHFRNVERHRVITSPEVLTLRIDESLYFTNARYLEDRFADLAADRPALKHVILMCSAVNHIDASALESLEAINRNFKAAGITFHLSEVKGPVMDRLKRSHFLDDLTGRVFLAQFDAIRALDPAVAAKAA
ncbi:MAG TPA: sulfate permease [Hyphomicrobiaceae bacterium]|nr:sulfate permease [Hyphomicrobiaceae bacterium]